MCCVSLWTEDWLLGGEEQGVSRGAPLQGDERIHVSQFTVDGKLMETYFDDVTTLYEGFLRGMKVSGECPTPSPLPLNVT